MSDFTPRANLRLPGGGSTGTILPDEQVDIDVLNDNFRKIDALLGARNIPSASSYSGSMDGDLVYARDTGFLHMFSTTAGGLITPRLPGARQYSGTQAERVAFVSKAKDGDLWRDTDNIGVIWVLKAGTPNTWVYSGNKLRGDRTAMDKLVTDGMAVEGMTVFNTTDNSEYVKSATAWSLTSGSFNSKISAPVALGGSWSMLTNLVASVNEVGATVASGVITLNKPGLVLISGKWQHNGSPNVSISTALTLNSTAQPTPSTTLLDAAATANGVEGTAIHRATTGDTLRMWAASGAVSAIGQTGLSLAYL